jgi:tetratricopeptide (TPR) repeat protein
VKEAKMAFTEETINEILRFGRQAVTELKNNSLNKFEEYGEMGFNLYPETIENNNIASDFMQDLGYRYIKSMLNGHLKNNNLEMAKKWLDRLADVNNIVHFSDEEVGFYYGKYNYEKGNLEEAYKQWREVVKRSGNNHFRYFEDEDKKYLEFYKKQKKLEDKK